jgi:hypothetical protein
VLERDKSPRKKKCDHKRTFFSFGTLGDYEECESCGKVLKGKKISLEEWLSEGLQGQR